MASITSSLTKRSTSCQNLTHDITGTADCKPTGELADGLYERFEQNYIGGVRPGLRNRGGSQQEELQRVSEVEECPPTLDPFTASTLDSLISNENEKVSKDADRNVRKRWTNPPGLGRHSQVKVYGSSSY